MASATLHGGKKIKRRRFIVQHRAQLNFQVNQQEPLARPVVMNKSIRISCYVSVPHSLDYECTEVNKWKLRMRRAGQSCAQLKLQLHTDDCYVPWCALDSCRGGEGIKGESERCTSIEHFPQRASSHVVQKLSENGSQGAKKS